MPGRHPPPLPPPRLPLLSGGGARGGGTPTPSSEKPELPHVAREYRLMFGCDLHDALAGPRPLDAKELLEAAALAGIRHLGELNLPVRLIPLLLLEDQEQVFVLLAAELLY